MEAKENQTVDGLIAELRCDGYAVNVHIHSDPVIATAGNIDGWEFGRGQTLLSALIDLKKKIVGN